MSQKSLRKPPPLRPSSRHRNASQSSPQPDEAKTFKMSDLINYSPSHIEHNESRIDKKTSASSPDLQSNYDPDLTSLPTPDLTKFADEVENADLDQFLVNFFPPANLVHDDCLPAYHEQMDTARFSEGHESTFNLQPSLGTDHYLDTQQIIHRPDGQNYQAAQHFNSLQKAASELNEVNYQAIQESTDTQLPIYPSSNSQYFQPPILWPGTSGDSWGSGGVIDPCLTDNQFEDAPNLQPRYPAGLRSQVAYSYGEYGPVGGDALDPSLTDCQLANITQSQPQISIRRNLENSRRAGRRHPRKRTKTNSKAFTETIYPREQPQLDEKHSWVRTNSKSVGYNSRSGKINNYDPEADGGYETQMSLAGTWTYGNSIFQYTSDGELACPTYSIEQMQDFIFNRGGPGQKHLIIWIQKTPADSARRYPTNESSKCRFEDCPAKRFSRSISVGLYRVAFDENWERFGDVRDPFKVAGYAHLYCMERFLDFPAICTYADVRADNRIIKSEPRGRFAPRLAATLEHNTAQDFISQCKNGTLWKNTSPFQNYPIHSIYSQRRPKEHQNTLNCGMTKAKLQQMEGCKRTMLESRGLKDSHMMVHLGDLDMQINARAAENARKRELNRVTTQKDHHLLMPLKRRRKNYLDVSHQDFEGSDGVHDESDYEPQDRQLQRKRKRSRSSRDIINFTSSEFADIENPLNTPGPNVSRDAAAGQILLAQKVTRPVQATYSNPPIIRAPHALKRRPLANMKSLPSVSLKLRAPLVDYEDSDTEADD